MTENLKLLNLQEAFARDTGHAESEFVGLSLYETLKHLILLDETSKASSLKSSFKISDSKFWWIKVRALVEKRAWAQLDSFSRAKISPIGYEVFLYCYTRLLELLLTVCSHS